MPPPSAATATWRRRRGGTPGGIFGVDPSGWELLRTDVIDRALPAHPPGQPLARRVDLGDGFFVAGDHRDTPSIQGALVSGRRAADAVVAPLGS